MKNYQINATLQRSGDTFVFNVPKVTKVNYKGKVHWKVNVKGLQDPAQVKLLVEFTKSNSQTLAKSAQNMPFDGGSSGNIHIPGTEQYRFIYPFNDYQGSSAQTDNLPLVHDTSLEGQTVVYNYTLWASIPADQLPSGVGANSDTSVASWPNIKESDGNKYLVVRHDPEMYVDEC